MPFRWWVWWVLSTTILPAQRALFLYIASNLDVGFGVSRFSQQLESPDVSGFSLRSGKSWWTKVLSSVTCLRGLGFSDAGGYASGGCFDSAYHFDMPKVAPPRKVHLA